MDKNIQWFRGIKEFPQPAKKPLQKTTDNILNGERLHAFSVRRE